MELQLMRYMPALSLPIVLLALLPGCDTVVPNYEALPQELAIPGPGRMTPEQAWRIVRREYQRAYTNVRLTDRKPSPCVRMTHRETQGDNIVNLETVNSVKLRTQPPCYWKVTWLQFPAEESWLANLRSRSAGENFARALKVLAAKAQLDADAWYGAVFERFKETARAWRELPTKPAMPEEARRHKVVAEDALRQGKRDLIKAYREYDAALDAFPCWPEGHFNLALTSGELMDYGLAIYHMKCYLELAPDASDARAARDKIYLWQDKMKAP